jgi:dinuclear metal center YbgI/SA1388 family protein
MTPLHELVAYANDLLAIGLFQDYCPNGLQVEGRNDVRRLVAGVTASQRLVDGAAARGADVLLVHHGYFWKGEDPCITGMKRRRLAKLISADVSLLAYHLPLDAHVELGNNAQLARVLGFVVEGQFGSGPGPKIGCFGTLPEPVAATELAVRITDRLGRAPLHLAGESGIVRRIGWCTGAAQSYLEQAADLGLDAFVSGEVSEQTTHVVRERGIHFYAAGHHATERYGVQALGRHLAERFGLAYEYIDIDNPV